MAYDEKLAARARALLKDTTGFRERKMFGCLDRTRKDSPMTTQVGALAHQAEIRSNIVVNSEFDVAYVVMNGLATVIACYGLFSNSPAVVIGAMIIAMLLGPI